MRQSRLMSLVEALANVAVGCCAAVLTQTPVYPRFELDTILRQNPTIGLIFKVVSTCGGMGCCAPWLHCLGSFGPAFG